MRDACQRARRVSLRGPISHRLRHRSSHRPSCLFLLSFYLLQAPPVSLRARARSLSLSPVSTFSAQHAGLALFPFVVCGLGTASMIKDPPTRTPAKSPTLHLRCYPPVSSLVSLFLCMFFSHLVRLLQRQRYHGGLRRPQAQLPSRPEAGNARPANHL